MEHTEFLIEKLGEAKLPSPLTGIAFAPDDATIAYNSDAAVLAECVKSGKPIPAFEAAGPREKIFHDPAWSKAAILTAGGLCPGLNDVIKFLTLTLKKSYHVPMVYGIRYGYQGLVPDVGLSPVILDEDNTDDIHELGGSILGAGRGEQDVAKMVDTLVRMNINMLFCIGGDGTSRCAHKIFLEIQKRKLAISVICIPKTIDNDIAFIDQSFGFETAVATAGMFITGAHNEAKGAYNGIGLVKVMGRDSGFIAACTTLANSFINYCLVPEVKFELDGDGPRALLPHLLERIKRKHHAVIIVAEGAGQEFFEGMEEQHDASGNKLHKDIGLFLKDRINAYFKEKNTPVTIKYFDPSYSIRSVAAHGGDAIFCAMLAQNAVHAAMSGRTDMVVGHWGTGFTHVPVALATRERKKINPASALWTGVQGIATF